MGLEGPRREWGVHGEGLYVYIKGWELVPSSPQCCMGQGDDGWTEESCWMARHIAMLSFTNRGQGTLRKGYRFSATLQSRLEL